MKGKVHSVGEGPGMNTDTRFAPVLGAPAELNGHSSARDQAQSYLLRNRPGRVRGSVLLLPVRSACPPGWSAVSQNAEWLSLRSSYERWLGSLPQFERRQAGFNRFALRLVPRGNTQ